MAWFNLAVTGAAIATVAVTVVTLLFKRYKNAVAADRAANLAASILLAWGAAAPTLLKVAASRTPVVIHPVPVVAFLVALHHAIATRTLASIRGVRVRALGGPSTGAVSGRQTLPSGVHAAACAAVPHDFVPVVAAFVANSQAVAALGEACVVLTGCAAQAFPPSLDFAMAVAPVIHLAVVVIALLVVTHLDFAVAALQLAHGRGSAALKPFRHPAFVTAISSVRVLVIASLVAGNDPITANGAAAVRPGAPACAVPSGFNFTRA